MSDMEVRMFTAAINLLAVRGIRTKRAEEAEALGMSDAQDGDEPYGITPFAQTGQAPFGLPPFPPANPWAPPGQPPAAAGPPRNAA